MKTKHVLLSMALIAIFLISCTKNDAPIDLAVVQNQNFVINGGQVSGTWKAKSIYTITGSFEIPMGQSLTIEDGVKVVIKKNEAVPVEIMVYGNLYCLGKDGSLIQFTIPDSLRATNPSRVWGGIFAADKQTTPPNLVFQYCTFEYSGALTTNNSYSAHTFKSTVGKAVPAINVMDQNSNLIVQNCKFSLTTSDATYMQGGNMIFSNNVFESCGDETGGEGINLKSGIIADCGFNLFYGQCNSSFKLSGSTDGRTPGKFTVYNNTIVNSGNRKVPADFGSMYMELLCTTNIYNNLIVNCRSGILNSLATPASASSAVSNNFYYANTQAMVDAFQESYVITGKSGIFKGETSSVKGTLVGTNDPKFVSYDLSTSPTKATMDATNNFHLQTSSPALTAGAASAVVTAKLNFPNGITINGVTYKAPAPAAYCGRYGIN
ncbi:MAG: hypothetical protein WCK18_09170 [Prolixibacteraceae bacterium]